jgi:hypothetical protein
MGLEASHSLITSHHTLYMHRLLNFGDPAGLYEKLAGLRPMLLLHGTNKHVQRILQRVDELRGCAVFSQMYVPMRPEVVLSMTDSQLRESNAASAQCRQLQRAQTNAMFDGVAGTDAAARMLAKFSVLKESLARAAQSKPIRTGTGTTRQELDAAGIIACKSPKC